MARWIDVARIKSILTKLEVDYSDWDDAELRIAIDVHQNVFLNYVGRSIESTARVDRINGSGIPSLVCPDRPIITLTSATILSYPNEEYGPSDLYVEPEEAILWLLTKATPGITNNWPMGSRNIEITATYGYGTIPEDIQEAIALAAAAHVMIMEPSDTSGESTPASLQSFRIGNYAEVFGKGGKHGNTIGRWDSLIKGIADSHRLSRIL